MPDNGSTALVELVRASDDHPACTHPGWCDRDRCLRWDNGDVNHLSAVQAVVVDADGGEGRIEFWLYRYDEKLRNGAMGTGSADVELQLVLPLLDRVPVWLDRTALEALSAMAAGLLRQEPLLAVAPGVSDA